jgi:hypothetical protein
MVRFKRDPTGPGTVIDRRGGGSLLKMSAGGGGVIAAIFLIVSLLTGDPTLGGLVDDLVSPALQRNEAPLNPEEDPDSDLVGFLGDVLSDAQAMWADVFARSGLDYVPTDLVVFNGTTQSGCGGAYAQTGPHYCPLDGLVYMDLDFLRELQARFGAKGDTAQAYIVAHEVAHHVQNQLGILEEVERVRQTDSAGSQEAAISLELQADCFAGVWLSTLNTGTSAAVLEKGDLQEALDAAAAVGDDNIQRQTTGRIDPESWTHGSSEQRLHWISQGYDTGDPSNCDTF